MSSNAKLQLSVLFLLALMGGMIWDNYHRYHEYKALLYSQLDARLYESAIIGAKLVGDDFHNALTDKESVTKVQEKRNESMLNLIADNSKITYLYSAFDDHGTVRVGAASNPEEDYQKGMLSHYYDPYPEVQSRVQKVLKTQRISYYEYSDRWGEFRSIFIPLKSSNGTPYVMVADIDIGDINEMLKHAIIDFIQVPFTILIIVSGLGFYYIRLSEKITGQLKNSNLELEHLRKTLEAKIAEKTLDLEVKNHQLQQMNTALENRVDEEISKKIINSFTNQD